MEEEFLDYMRESHNKALPFEEMVKAELARLNVICSGLRGQLDILQIENERLEDSISRIADVLIGYLEGLE